jgi:uncharacterized protein DUF3558
MAAERARRRWSRRTGTGALGNRFTAGLSGLLLAGCSAPVTPAPAGPPPVQTTTAPTLATVVAGPDPCSLLSTVDRSTAGLSTPGEGRTIGRDRACEWTEPGTFGLTVTVADSTPLSGLRTPEGTAQRSTVGRHRAIRVSDAAADDGTCAVLLAAGENASVQVDVTNSAFHDTALACRRADTVAQLIEPRLP